ncbi:pyridoxal phosphate-dependent class II aminotransferase [Ruegeria sp. 2205SS24-7]|uniref:threonine-phosphate decarboxylase n=1 Tax=Ruegeria discodermiae TaxID=3064389 RepID=UPI0027414BCB|nr:threonine-phosphate decarboxylase [Ruegeria sp. 2205SS24-7]MDP5218173.1 pyridoxal phosphate-dependent class II aminotransferase [Ruegeria sp. 2205SS24-7]
MSPTHSRAPRDHGGGIDSAIVAHGGARAGWLDLSTGINPEPYPLPVFTPEDWAALPDNNAFVELETAARQFWKVPDGARILPAPGASAPIARLPALAPAGRVQITTPTYNEHAAAFAAQGWQVAESGPAEARVIVHPNNPDGRFWSEQDADAPLTIIDESFCDVMPSRSLAHLAARPRTLILKSFGKFWGLAGLRLGFAIGQPDLIDRLGDLTGPWAVSGPALRIGALALRDSGWAVETRARLERDAARLDGILTRAGAELEGGTSLFRLYRVDDAAAWQDRLAKSHIWSRIFPYSQQYLRLGLPPASGWERLEAAL